MTNIKNRKNHLNHLPEHGRVNCTKCFSQCSGAMAFDQTKRTEGDWRITQNPLAWGNTNPEVIVLGFSKGPTQAGALTKTHHDQIAYKGSRGNVGRILKHVGLLQQNRDETPGETVDRLIADRHGKLHFGSLIRCTVERLDKGSWKGSGGGMLDKFVATPFGREVSSNCVAQFLKDLPPAAKIIIMFGMGSKLNYVQESYSLYRSVRGGNWRWINDVAYTDGKVTVVHVEHFASQGNLIPRWLGEQQHARSNLGQLAASAVSKALGQVPN
jgi:hypothetical protein